MSNYLLRMHRYLGIMFPLPRHIFLAALIYLSVACFTTQLYGTVVSLSSYYTVLGVGSVFGLFLMLRLMDELKDYDLDAKLFPERPICTGMVRAADIRIGLALVTTAILVANMFAGNAFWSALLLVVYAFLMFLHFFRRDTLRASLPLTVVSHQPIFAFLLLHCLNLVSVEQDVPWRTWEWRLITPYFVLLWLPFLGWELSRKIRSPKDETEYVTYSRLLGPERATYLAATIEAIPLLAAAYLYWALRLPGFYLLLMIGTYLVYLSTCVRFLRDTRRSAKSLKGFAEFYLVAVLIVQIAAFGLLSRS
jgi:hypothetical protein